MEDNKFQFWLSVSVRENSIGKLKSSIDEQIGHIINIGFNYDT